MATEDIVVETAGNAPVPAAAAPDEQTLLADLQKAAKELITVRVATVISDATVVLKEGGSLDTVQAPTTPVKAIVTNVNLLDGDITTIIAPELEPNTDLRAYHDEALERALKVLPENLETLARVIKSIFK